MKLYENNSSSWEMGFEDVSNQKLLTNSHINYKVFFAAGVLNISLATHWKDISSDLRHTPLDTGSCGQSNGYTKKTSL